MLIRHAHRGMLTLKVDAFRTDLERDTGVHPSLADEAFLAPEADPRQSIARAKASSFLLHRDAVRGFIYDG